MTPEQKESRQQHHERALILLEDVNILHEDLAKWRHHYGVKYGDNGSPNRYPISGGLCEHWPDDAKAHIRTDAHRASDMLRLALKHWRAAGKRDHTFTRECYSGKYPNVFPPLR